MIGSFKCKRTMQVYEGKPVKKWKSFVRQAERKLQILDAAVSLDDLHHLPGNRFEALKGTRKGQYSIRINKQWRICFKWSSNMPQEVEIVDYH